MSQHAAKEISEPDILATKPSEGPVAMCPMARLCMGMMGKRPAGYLLIFPGVFLIAVGALIVIEPELLAWLMAAASVLLGIILLMMAGFIRKIDARLRG